MMMELCPLKRDFATFEVLSKRHKRFIHSRQTGDDNEDRMMMMMSVLGVIVSFVLVLLSRTELCYQNENTQKIMNEGLSTSLLLFNEHVFAIDFFQKLD